MLIGYGDCEGTYVQYNVAKVSVPSKQEQAIIKSINDHSHRNSIILGGART